MDVFTALGTSGMEYCFFVCPCTYLRRYIRPSPLAGVTSGTRSLWVSCFRHCFLLIREIPWKTRNGTGWADGKVKSLHPSVSSPSYLLPNKIPPIHTYIVHPYCPGYLLFPIRTSLIALTHATHQGLPHTAYPLGSRYQLCFAAPAPSACLDRAPAVPPSRLNLPSLTWLRNTTFVYIHHRYLHTHEGLRGHETFLPTTESTAAITMA